MRIHYLLSAILAMLLATSCQKELSLENGNGNGSDPGTGGNNGTGVLTRIEMKMVPEDPNNFTVTDYGYDAQGRLVTVRGSGKSDGESVNSFKRAIRAADGTLTGYVEWNDELGDSLYVKLLRDIGKRLIATTRSLDAAFTIPFDSTVYKYNSSTSIDGTTYFTFDPAGVIPSVIFKNTFSGDLLVRNAVQAWDDNTNTWGLTIPSSFSYDDKKAPLAYTVEDLLCGWAAVSGNRNLLKFESSDGGSEKMTQTMTYNYNADGRPKNGTVKITITGLPDMNSTLAFYYK
jgi:hypothetical protein